ncbi:SurA N-terminal domain-containing protein [Chthonobacter albigriseus]|uniref:SurA N-terminal domain-containing protein n=1 Tax=Chthonobacter albigriseus TaxID=1683161 RepID=UPI0015EE78E1|nr:SurA N-terminal domain-containing protein [Chthonobacter albigriseus]
MLDSLRRGANTIVAKILLGLLVVSFAVWGIADVFRSTGSQSVAEVGDTEVSLTDFGRQYQREIQAFSRQYGQPITPELAAQLGLPSRLLGRMISEAALTDTATSMGLGVSDEAIAKTIAADPNFQAGGKFDRAYFNQLINQNGLTEAQYIAEQRSLLLRRQLAEGLFGGMGTPTTLLEQLSRYRDEVRIVDYIELPRSLITPIPTPSGDELQTYYDANKDQYRAPEYRKLDILTLTPDDIADPSAVTDEDARKEYERTKGQYGTAEQRRIQQILFPTIEEAKAASDKIKGGATFEQIVGERNLKPEDIDLGLLTKDRVVDPAIAEAAFGLGAGAVSDAVEARFGGALVRVTEIVPQSVRPFEDVAAEIKASIARRAAEGTVLETHDEIEDARAGGATLAEIAERFKLKVRTIEAVDAEGKDAAGATVDIPQSTEVVAAAFASDVGVENDPVSMSNRGFVFFDVVDVRAARDRPLEEVKDQVTKGWTEARIGELLQAKADDLQKSVAGGQDLAVAAQSVGATVKTTQAFARNGQIADLTPAGVDAAFGGPEGHVATVEKEDGSRLLIKVKSAVVPPFFAEAAGNAEAAKGFAEELQSSLLSQYIEQRQAELGSSVNQAALQQVIGLAGR